MKRYVIIYIQEGEFLCYTLPADTLEEALQIFKGIMNYEEVFSISLAR